MQKALSAFDRHEKSELHRSSLKLPPNQRIQTVTQTENGNNKRKQSSFGKNFISLRFLGCQGLAIREKEEDTSNPAMLLQERKEDVAELKEWPIRKDKFLFSCDN